MTSLPIRLSTFLPLFALLALAACDRGEDDGQGVPEGRRGQSVGVVSHRVPVTRDEYLRMPDSVRLDGDLPPAAGDRGVAVELAVTLTGLAGDSIPLAATLHDARNDLPFVSRTLALTPDAERWRRQGWVWVQVPSAGSYYVRLALADSSGRSTSGPRTQAFTID